MRQDEADSLDLAAEPAVGTDIVGLLECGAGAHRLGNLNAVPASRREAMIKGEFRTWQAAVFPKGGSRLFQPVSTYETPAPTSEM